MAKNPHIKTAFVSTNSVCQGEQVPVLWGDLLNQGIEIDFAYRPFQWTSQAKGKAAVHCVIVGFSVKNSPLSPSAHFPQEGEGQTEGAFSTVGQGEGKIAKQVQKIEQAAQRILDVRENYRQQAVDWNEKIAKGEIQGNPIAVPCLADFYRAGNLYTELTKAHQALDKAVDNAYGYQGGNNDEARVAFLFGLLQQNSVEK